LQALTDAAYQADQDGTAKDAKKAARENVADADSNMDGQEMAAGQKIKVTVQAQGRADVVFEVSSDKKILKLMTAYSKAMVTIILNVCITCVLNKYFAEMQPGWAEVLQHGQ
jgi:hypothetical protein